MDCHPDHRINSFKIFNRYGGMVYTADVDMSYRDGHYRGEAVETGVFIRMLQYETSITGQNRREVLQGDITVLR